jgi:hypothetical protein
MNQIFGLPILFQDLSSALQVLTAMLTPALLLSACGNFIISTSNRLGRVVDRVRKLSDRMEEVLREESDPELTLERTAMIEKQLDLQSRRASLLMRILVALYYASGLFVLTSVSIGVVTITSTRLYVIPVALGVGGAVMLLVAAVRLVTEARLALDGLHEETDFLQKITALRSRRALSNPG